MKPTKRTITPGDRFYSHPSRLADRDIFCITEVRKGGHLVASVEGAPAHCRVSLRPSDLAGRVGSRRFVPDGEEL